MRIAPLPGNEHHRLDDLYAYEILDTKPESDFDELVELAGNICKCPISLITLIDKERQWFKAKKGTEIPGSPRNVAICAHTILQDGIMVIEDTTKDERFYNNPSVTGSLGIRFYAGTPIFSSAGYKLGTLCIVDNKPRSLSAEEQRALVLLSNQVTRLLEIRKKNMAIRKRAEEIIKLKSNAVNKFIQDIENDKKMIAINLHEQFAQEIASSLMYVKMAASLQTDKGANYLQVAGKQLDDTLTAIRDLSYKITPLAVQCLHSEEVIKEYIKRIETTFPFSIETEFSNIADNIDPDILLTAIRMMEQWFKTLSNQSNVSKVSLYIGVEKELVLNIIDNGEVINFLVKEKQVLQHILCDSVYAMGGTINISVAGNKNLFTVSLPLQSATTPVRNLEPSPAQTL